MAGTRFKIQLIGRALDDEDVRLDILVDQLNRIRVALRETNRIVADDRLIYFRLVDLTHNSPATLELEATPSEAARPGDAEAVAVRFVMGWQEIAQGHIPSDFDYQTVQAFRDVAELVTEKKIGGLVISQNDTRISIVPDIVSQIDFLIGPDYYENGSITGMLHHVNLHRRQPGFTVYPTSNRPRLHCVFPPHLRSKVVDAVDRYVTVYGRLKYKLSDDYPYEMTVTEIEVHPPDDTLPTLASLRGLAPDATGEKTTEQFIQDLRNEW